MRLDKPRVRIREKQYLRETADEGKLKRVMKGREYFYVVAEAEGGGVVTGSEQPNLEQPRTFRATEPSETRYEKWGIHEPLVGYLLYGLFI
jgi:hypothetical protein